ncbi:MAG: ribbon-helix-helix domain-containing protein [Candidatus Methylomirabilia bacterium]
MRRTEVYLTEAQHRKLEVMAKSLGLPMAELIRQGVNLVLCEKARLGQDSLLKLVGQAGPAGRSDIAAEHDAYATSLSLETGRQ